MPPPNRAPILIPTYNEVKNVGRVIDSIALSGIEAGVCSRDREAGEGRQGGTQEQAVGLWQPPGSFHFGAGVNFF